MAEPVIDPGGGGRGNVPDKPMDGQSPGSDGPVKDQVADLS